MVAYSIMTRLSSYECMFHLPPVWLKLKTKNTENWLSLVSESEEKNRDLSDCLSIVSHTIAQESFLWPLGRVLYLESESVLTKPVFDLAGELEVSEPRIKLGAVPGKWVCPSSQIQSFPYLPYVSDRFLLVGCLLLIIDITEI